MADEPQLPHDDDEEPTPLGPLLLGGAFFLLLAGGVAYLLFGSDPDQGSEIITYSKDLAEVMGSQEEFEGRGLRVEGDLRNGTMCFRDEPCEWRFVLERDGQQMPVHFPSCVVPDTFRDQPGVVVTVQGRLQADGVFLAEEVVPRCPSKYEPGEEPTGQMPTTGEMAPSPMHSPNPCG